MSLPRPAALAHALASYHDENPERWVLVLAAGAWIAMLPHALASTPACHQLSFWGDWQAWLLMVGAMMLPLISPSVRWVAERTFRTRQLRSMVAYVLGYLLPWMALGLVVAWLLGRPGAHQPGLAPLAFAVAGVWSATPLYQRMMGESHRTLPLAPRGWPADRDCLRFGLAQGLPCLASCAPLMLGCTLTGHGLVAMLGGAAIGASERLLWRPRPWLTPLGCAGLAAWYGVVAAG